MSLVPKKCSEAAGIRAMIQFDDVRGSIDDGTEFGENYVQMTEDDPTYAEDATSDGYSCYEMVATDSCFQWKGQDEVGEVKCSTDIRRRRQNILRKFPRFIGQAGKTSTPFEARKCLITDEIVGNYVLHTNHHILIQPNFSVASHTTI